MQVPGWRKARRAATVARRRLRPRPVILMYHRIATPACDPWDIAVSPDHFAEHVEVLAERCRVAPLHDVAEERARPRVAITFDDAYLDVLETALPRLERRGVPATVFAVAEPLSTPTPRPPWWDRVALALLHQESLPGALDLEPVPGRWSVPAPEARDLSRWRAEPVSRRERRASTPARAALYLDVSAAIAALDTGPRERAADALIDWARSAGARIDHDPQQRPMSRPELARLARSERVTIGSHTRTHPFLSSLGPDAQRDEIAGSRDALEAALGREVLDFSFPNGDVPAGAVSLVREAGYRLGCTSRSADVAPDDDPHALPRLIVRDMDGARFRRWLWTWGHG